MSIVREKIKEGGIRSLLKPVQGSEVIENLKKQLEPGDIELLKEIGTIEIYKIKNERILGSKIKGHGSSREENIFYNFYLILDDTGKGHDKVITVKVNPDNDIDARNYKGNRISKEYLEKRFGL